MTEALPEQELILLYRETVRPLYGYVSRRVGGDAGLAEDLVQETWIRALDAWPGKGIPDDPLAWLMRVAHNVLMSHFRQFRLQPIDGESINLDDEKFSPATPDAAAAVGWGMARLRRSHADVLEAFYFDGKTVREIAAELSVSERAVEGRLRRARAKLKKKLDRVLRPSATSPRPATKGDMKDAKPTRAR